MSEATRIVHTISTVRLGMCTILLSPIEVFELFHFFSHLASLGEMRLRTHLVLYPRILWGLASGSSVLSSKSRIYTHSTFALGAQPSR